MKNFPLLRQVRFSFPFKLLLLAGFVLGMSSGALQAQTAVAPAVAPALAPITDPVLEKRVHTLSDQLRCLVCQNQTIADSNASLAIDLRNQVREKMTQGWSDDKVMDFMVQRYGEFVLYNPPLRTATWLLWFGPFALFFGALLMLMMKLKKTRQQAEPSAAQLKSALGMLEPEPPLKNSTPVDKGAA
jgi:cytochrome c-type biogenesis protein CcmH